LAATKINKTLSPLPIPSVVRLALPVLVGGNFFFVFSFSFSSFYQRKESKTRGMVWEYIK